MSAEPTTASVVWEAFAPSGAGARPTSFGLFTGEMDDVIDWVTATKDPKFCEGIVNKWGHDLRCVEIPHITPEKVEELRAAQQNMEEAKAKVRAAGGDA